MRMIINKNDIKLGKYFALCITMLLLFSCGGNKEDEQEKQAAVKDSLSRPEYVKTVYAIAKVEPLNGLVQLSAATSGIVTEVYKNVGDSLLKGDLIIKIDHAADLLAVDLARRQIATQQSRAAADRANVNQYLAILKEKEQDLAITKQLASTGADTRQNVAIKQKEQGVILANLQSAKATAAAGEAEIAALKKQLQQAQLTLNDKLIRTKENGILVSMDAKVGTAVNALAPFATMAPQSELVLKGEIDEMFADRVQLGQQVVVNYVGNNKQIASGEIIYLSPVLEEKSLFYEKPGETSDRRVRLFKVSLDKGNELLINAKVECAIKIQ
ncbi:HlyD family secretion protein [Pedobacter immunditicola]|uniref:HlyD family secretion protein n=1 Tax=Pedobacter immunditicola TaxID=3133440 RepID=UPI00309B9A9C